MSKIAIGMRERLSARGNTRGRKDLVAADTANAGDEEGVSDEEVDGHVPRDRIKRRRTLDALQRRDRHRVVLRVHWAQSHYAYGSSQLIDVVIERVVARDVKLQHVGAAVFGSQHEWGVPADCDSPQPRHACAYGAYENVGVDSRNSVDRHVKRRDDATAERTPQTRQDCGQLGR